MIFTPFIGLIGLYLSLSLYFGIRGAWISFNAIRHSAHGTYWVRRSKQGAVAADELSQLWPPRSILFDLPWRWEWRRYVVHQDRYDELQHFIYKEMLRQDLDFQKYHEEMEADLASGRADLTRPAEGVPTSDQAGSNPPVS